MDDIEAFGEDSLEWFRKFTHYLSAIPNQDTTARIIGLVDPDELFLCFTWWCDDVESYYKTMV